MARPARFEHAAYGLEVRCSIQLSYGRKQKIFLSKFTDLVHRKLVNYFFSGTYIAFKNYMIMVYSTFQS